MTTPLAQPPKKQDARFDDWIFRLWKRLTRTSSTELGLGTMADQDADAVAITGGTAALTGDSSVTGGRLTITLNNGTTTSALRANRTYTDGSDSRFGVLGNVVPTSATNGARYSLGFAGLVYPVIEPSVTESGYVAGGSFTALRNSTGASVSDNGTLSQLMGLLLIVGNNSVNSSATPITTDVYGVKVIAYASKGTITNFYGSYVSKAGAGGTLTNCYGSYSNIASGDATNAYNFYAAGTAPNWFSGDVVVFGAGKLGYETGSGGTVTQGISRTTGVTLNKTNGAITLVSAAGSATWQSFTLTNSTIAATDTVRVCQKSGTDLYQIHVTAVAAGSCQITYATTGGTTTEQPVFNFAVLKGVTS